MPNPKLETYKNKATGTVYDYTDAAAQAALAGILDGTDINNFSDVETALATKVDKVTGKGLSTNDYDNTEKAKVAGAFPRSEQAVLGAKNRWNFPAWKSVGLSDATATWDDDTYTLTLTATANSGRSNITVPVDAQIDVKPGEQIKFVWDSTGSSIDGLMTFDVFKVGDTSAPIASAGVRDNELIMTVPANCYKLTYRVLSGSADKVIKIANCMCVLASDMDKTFAPYAMTNKELTEKVNEIEAGKIEVSGNSATFDVPLIRANEHAYTYGLITFSGGLYHFWLKSSDESDAVVITKIIDANSSRTLSATYANGKLSLTFSATIYGGVMVFTSNV